MRGSSLQKSRIFFAGEKTRCHISPISTSIPIVIYGVFNMQSEQPGTRMMCINLLFFDLSYFFLLKKSLLKNVVFLIAFSGFYNAIEVSALAFLQTDVFKMAG